MLLLIEQVLPERLEAGAAAQAVARLDLQMLVLTPGGRERTEEEFRSPRIQLLPRVTAPKRTRG